MQNDIAAGKGQVGVPFKARGRVHLEGERHQQMAHIRSTVVVLTIEGVQVARRTETRCRHSHALSEALDLPFSAFPMTNPNKLHSCEVGRRVA